MDRISRTFTKIRSSGYTTTHIFTTFSFVFFDSNELLSYLVKLFSCGADIQKKLSASTAKSLMLEMQPVENSELVELTIASKAIGNGKNQHFILEQYFLKKDQYTLATEVPVWSEKYNMSGFIDILRVKNKRIQICDFKPYAHREKKEKALTQLWYYREMLKGAIEGMNMPIDCFYFDDQNCYKLL